MTARCGLTPGTPLSAVDAGDATVHGTCVECVCEAARCEGADWSS